MSTRWYVNDEDRLLQHIANAYVMQADGSFVMYYSATTTSDTSKHCVGAATSKTVTGPYNPVGSTALICPLSQGGAIDASGVVDGYNRYIVYKVDGNSIGHGGACGNNSMSRRGCRSEVLG